jgi:hypothetical protein
MQGSKSTSILSAKMTLFLNAQHNPGRFPVVAGSSALHLTGPAAKNSAWYV